MTYKELDLIKDDDRLSDIEKENINYVLKYWIDIVAIYQVLKESEIK